MNRIPSGNEIPWTFKTWISRFKGVDLPIGDLADDITRDSDFPEHDDFGEIHEYINQKSKGDFGGNRNVRTGLELLSSVQVIHN